MAYSRKPYSKKTYSKKVYPKKSVARKVYKPKGRSTKSLISLIKNVSLKQSETKNTIYTIENQQLNHNVGLMTYNFLNTLQGVGDNTGTTSNKTMRVGDEVIGRGISIKVWVANKLDRPNVMYRVFCYKYQDKYPPPTIGDLFKNQLGNRMMDDLNTEKYTIVYHKRFNLQTGFDASASGTTFSGKEAHKFLSIWIPLKNQRIKYNDSEEAPKFFNYGFCLVPYDSYGTLVSDLISSMAINVKFYFKDP